VPPSSTPPLSHLDVYSHVLPNMQDEAAVAMESALAYRVGIRLASKSPGFYPGLSIVHVFSLQKPRK
jgi:hypothetical protein